jgi:hypothetical protein
MAGGWGTGGAAAPGDRAAAGAAAAARRSARAPGRPPSARSSPLCGCGAQCALEDGTRAALSNGAAEPLIGAGGGARGEQPPGAAARTTPYLTPQQAPTPAPHAARPDPAKALTPARSRVCLWLVNFPAGGGVKELLDVLADLKRRAAANPVRQLK